MLLEKNTKAKMFADLHHKKEPFILANAWDAASARIFEPDYAIVPQLVGQLHMRRTDTSFSLFSFEKNRSHFGVFQDKSLCLRSIHSPAGPR